MAIMNYETPGITGIEFEDNLFVTTEFDKDDNKKIKQYIEQCGGIVKNSVTRSTNYLLYENGEEETVKYRKALELVQEKGLDIIILSRKTFEKLITMTYETPGVSEIVINGKQFATTGFTMSELREYIEENGGTFDGFAAESTDYLIYENNEWMTDEYRKAIEVTQKEKVGLIVISDRTFNRLIRQRYDMEFGSYPFEADGTSHLIRWRILKREGNNALLLSTYGLDAKPYNERYEGVTWETCSLRKWLNEVFHRTAFTDEEKSRILPTKVKNEDNPGWHTPGGNDTEDRIFLLSSSEAKQYLATWLERVKILTPYAKKQGVGTGAGDECWWWLRSPGLDPDSAAGVSNYGFIFGFGSNVSNNGLAVCPALWINLDPEI